MYDLQRRNTKQNVENLLQIEKYPPPLNKIKWHSFVLPSLSRAYLMVL